MRTYVAKGEEAEALKVGANWFVVDATNVVLGRLATKVARMLIGKDKPSFTPYLDSGDHVVVINADKVRMTGNKVEQKIYYSHSGYPGGLKEVPAKRVRETKPEWMVREAVLGMLPKNKLRARRAKKLRVYRDAAGLARHAGAEAAGGCRLKGFRGSRTLARRVFRTLVFLLSGCLSREQSERGVLRLRGAVSSVEVSRRNVEFYWYNPLWAHKLGFWERDGARNRWRACSCVRGRGSSR